MNSMWNSMVQKKVMSDAPASSGTPANLGQTGRKYQVYLEIKNAIILLLIIKSFVSGSVRLDVINQSWSPMFDPLNVFEAFLPQLLLYPNPSGPLNGDAASLMMKDRKLYDQKVKGITSSAKYCERHAKKEHITNTTPDEESDENISDEESKLKGQ